MLSRVLVKEVWAVEGVGVNKELTGEVVRLAKQFGIITPYTSFLVTEKESRLLDAAAPEAQEALAARKTTGAGAFRIAKATQALKAQEQAVHVESQMIRYKSDKTFYLKDEVWVDSLYIEGEPAKKIIFGSEEYFKLISELSSFLWFIDIFMMGGKTGSNFIFYYHQWLIFY